MTSRSLNFFSFIQSDLQRFLNKKINYLHYGFIFHPRFLPVLFVRLARSLYLTPYLKPLSYIFVWLNVILFGIECSPKCEIGAGLLLPHTHGTVIGAFKLGDNVTIFQGVTLGAKALDYGFEKKLRPILGDRVVVGAGAKVLGPILIGNDVTIGANAVVLNSFANNTLVTGIPAMSRAKK
jgi:serine O-acetyltransferase